LPGIQSAVQVGAAKPRKPAKRKDKLSNSLFIPKIGHSDHPGAEAANPRKRQDNDMLGLLKSVSVSRRSKKMAFARWG